MSAWKADLHPRSKDGKFATKSGGSSWAEKLSDRIGNDLGIPEELSTTDFEREYGGEDSGVLYRGVGSDAGASATRNGELGGGDYGKGQYFSLEIGHAQSYSQTSGRDGIVIRAAVRKGSNPNIKRPPKKVQRGGSAAIDAWAKDNKVDIISLDNYQIVRSPGYLVFDRRNYTPEESAILDYLAKGYHISDQQYNDNRALLQELGWKGNQ
jgi:hypothetical protein